MKLFLKYAALNILIPFGVLCICTYKGFAVEQVYAKLQNSLFTGFLTLGGFLLSLKTFILVQLKKELYDSDSYQKHHEKATHIDESTPKLYAPLKALGEYLLYSVLLSLITSLSQVSIGFIPNKYVACFCLALPIATFIVVFRAWSAIRKTLNEWFNQMK